MFSTQNQIGMMFRRHENSSLKQKNRIKLRAAQPRNRPTKMIPILLHSHTRALTKIIYNREGDLLFTSAKDQTPNVFYSHNGERLGNFKGHNGTVWSLSVTNDSCQLASGSADNTAKIWNVETGTCKITLKDYDTAVRAVSWSANDQYLAVMTDATMGKNSQIIIYDVNNLKEPIRSISFGQNSNSDENDESGSVRRKPTVMAWTDSDRCIVTGHENGDLNLWDFESGKCLEQTIEAHVDSIRDLQLSKDKTYFITASRDTTSKIFDSRTLKCLKTYKTERPVNSAAISPIRPEVCIAGGQDALQVTASSSRAGQFEARFFHEVFENELGRVKGHFGPINTLAYNPDGLGYASGGEDGYIRLHKFDSDYFEFAPQFNRNLDPEDFIIH